MCENAFDRAQSLLETVGFQIGVGKCLPHAVFTESVRLDAQLPQQFQDWRRHEPVALEFDDCQAGEVVTTVIGQVVETQVGVDGETLGARLVDQRDSVEAVLEQFEQRVGGVHQVLSQEVVVSDKLVVLAAEHNVVARIHRVEILDGDTLFARAAMVVLGLHLQEVEI